MLLKSMLLVFFSFYTLDINMQKECESERDKISGCIEKTYYTNGVLAEKDHIKMVKWRE